MNRLQSGTIIATLLITIAPTFTQAANNEEPNQALWTATTGECDMNTIGRETTKQIKDAMLGCMNDGLPRGCTELEPPHGNLINNHKIGEEIGPDYNEAQNQWEYQVEYVCMSGHGAAHETWELWTRPACLDGDALGEDANGDFGICAERNQPARLEHLTNNEKTCKDGNPCDTESGDKIIKETDFEGVGLNFYRTWHSMVPRI